MYFPLLQMTSQQIAARTNHLLVELSFVLCHIVANVCVLNLILWILTDSVYIYIYNVRSCYAYEFHCVSLFYYLFITFHTQEIYRVGFSSDISIAGTAWDAQAPTKRRQVEIFKSVFDKTLIKLLYRLHLLITLLCAFSQNVQQNWNMWNCTFVIILNFKTNVMSDSESDVLVTSSTI